jgi:DNA-binding response OmpR family regulator
MNSRPVVMVVEDDAAMNELERDLLSVHGLDSVAAYTGPQAIEVSDRCNADAVLLDLMLPEMDGFETCARLRSSRGKQLPIVILSALDGDDSRRRGLEAGADAYFVKPFDPDEVVDKLRQLIERDIAPAH